MTVLTSRLKQRLWQWYGSARPQAEWDGQVMGGGKISQRFWEYHIALEMLDLDEGATVLDIGGGFPKTGWAGMFAQVLASYDINVVVLDQCRVSEPGKNIKIENLFANYDTLCDTLRKHHPTHIACLSVLEHCSEDEQAGIFRAIEEEFQGERAVFAFEFHETNCHFENQLTTKSLAKAVSPLQRYYLERMERTPVNAMNAQGQWYPLALQFNRKIS